MYIHYGKEWNENCKILKIYTKNIYIMDQWKYLNIIADQKIKYAPVISVVHFWPNSVNFVDFFYSNWLYI